jgi:hypothetical protein
MKSEDYLPTSLKPIRLVGIPGESDREYFVRLASDPVRSIQNIMRFTTSKGIS